MKKFSIIFLLMSLTFSLSGRLFAQDETTIRFTLWIPEDHPAMTEVFLPAAEAYSAENPGVTIEYSFIPFAEYEATLATQLSSDSPPDAGWLVERNGPAFVDADVLYDLAPTLTADEAYDFADFAETALSLWTDEGGVYGVPFSNSPMFTIYNQDLFEAAGLETPTALAERGEWTWDALASAAKTISEQTEAYGFVSLDSSLYTSTGQAWGTIVPLLRAYGTDIFAEDSCTLNSEEAQQAFSLLSTMVFEDQSVVPPGNETTFWTGEVGISLTQLSRLNNLDEAEFAWGIAPLPSGPAGEVSVIGQAAFVAFNGENNTQQESAANFVKFLTTQENIAALSKFFPPARASVLESEAFVTGNPRLDETQMSGVVSPAIASGSVLTAHKNFPEIELLGATALDMLWMPGADVPTSLETFCQLIQPSLAD